MNRDIQNYNDKQSPTEIPICNELCEIINQQLKEASSKIWHAHPVWFLNDNPIVGYSKQKAGIKLMFWSGADFNEENLQSRTGKFKDASIIYTNLDQINEEDLKRWLEKAKTIQWDYKNIVKRKGQLIRL